MLERVENAAASLDRIALAVLQAWNNDSLLLEHFGWNAPPVTRQDLADMARHLATDIRKITSDEIDPQLDTLLAQLTNKVVVLAGNVVPQLFNGGNSGPAANSYIGTLTLLSRSLEPFITPTSVDWSAVDEKSMLPAELRRRIRQHNAILTGLEVKEDELRGKLKLIDEAVDAAVAMPTDLAELQSAKTEMKESARLVAEASQRLSVTETDVSRRVEQIQKHEKEAAGLVEQCGEAYRITTTKGLAAAFASKATGLSISMWVWVGFLVTGLSVGGYLGYDRLQTLTDVLKFANVSPYVLATDILLSIFSVGGPLWFAWLATKQIGQRFRLAEDYAFKASVAKAYEGYRREATRIDPDFVKRLFGSALDRLDEAPLRLVENSSHGSPLHELVGSAAFLKAIDLFPALLDKSKTIPAVSQLLPRDTGRTSNAAVASKQENPD